MSGLGPGRFQIADDCQALGDPLPVQLQHRHQALRVSGAVFGLFLGAFGKVHRDAFIRDTLEVQGDPHSVAGGGAVIVEQRRFRHAPVSNAIVAPAPEPAPAAP
jgi:hypothetical protein